jgi:hypothetical protein
MNQDRVDHGITASGGLAHELQQQVDQYGRHGLGIEQVRQS